MADKGYDAVILGVVGRIGARNRYALFKRAKGFPKGAFLQETTENRVVHIVF